MGFPFIPMGCPYDPCVASIGFLEGSRMVPLIVPLGSPMCPIRFPKGLFARHLIYSWFPLAVLMLPSGRHVLYGLLLLCAWHVLCVFMCFLAP